MDAFDRQAIKTLVDRRRRDLEEVPQASFDPTRAAGRRTTPIMHGTESAYVNRGCRCDSCRTAASAARRFRRGGSHIEKAILTEAQLEVLRLAALGFSLARTAAFQGRSIETVKRHRAMIIVRLDAHDTTHAVALAIRQGLLWPKHVEERQAA